MTPAANESQASSPALDLRNTCQHVANVSRSWISRARLGEAQWFTSTRRVTLEADSWDGSQYNSITGSRVLRNSKQVRRPNSG